MSSCSRDCHLYCLELVSGTSEREEMMDKVHDSFE
jgi:hypothetical protein